MKIGNIEIQVLVNGQPVKQFAKNGRTFILANYGAEYSIKIRNNGWNRVLAVCSIDGISVISGNPASYNSGGYVVGGYSSIDIKGYRKDENEVGAFKFTKKRKGYAKDVTGSAVNSGIVSVAVFEEKQTVYQGSITWAAPAVQTFYCNTCETSIIGAGANQSARTSSNVLRSAEMKRGVIDESKTYGESATSFNNESNNVSNIQRRYLSQDIAPLKSVVKAEVPDFKAATTWGTRMKDEVKEVEFERASKIPYALFEIYYDTREGLEKIGIDFSPEKVVSYPESFPRAFATPPAGWHA